MENSYLYVIGYDTKGPVKLGISTDPERRLGQLQTGHAECLQVYHTAPVPMEKARLYERLLHRDMSHRRLRGEWFDLPVEDAIAHVEFTFIQYELVENLAEKVRLRRV